MQFSQIPLASLRVSARAPPAQALTCGDWPEKDFALVSVDCGTSSGVTECQSEFGDTGHFAVSPDTIYMKLWQTDGSFYVGIALHRGSRIEE